MSEKTVYVKCELTGCVSFEYLQIKTLVQNVAINHTQAETMYIHRDLIHKALPVSCDWDKIEKEFIHYWKHNPVNSSRVLDWLKSRIPQAEPANEWSEDKFYDYYVAMYLGRIHNLELRHLDFDESVWLSCRGIKTLPCNYMQADEQKWQLRKPKTVDEKLKLILNLNGVVTNADMAVQAIKDVFKEEKCQ